MRVLTGKFDAEPRKPFRDFGATRRSKFGHFHWAYNYVTRWQLLHVTYTIMSITNILVMSNFKFGTFINFVKFLKIFKACF